MTLGRPFAPTAATLLAIALVILALLSAWLVLVSPASAQSDEPTTCASGGAVPAPDNNPGLVSDCEALLASRDTLAGTVALNWSADTPIADWEGVTVEGTPERVTRLDLARLRLTGEIPTELGSLAELRFLSLHHNLLTGPIPTELASLTNLEVLDLSDNMLSGPIPVQLGGLANLNDLNLFLNQLTGSIPAELADLSGLTKMTISWNPLTGSIPSEFGRLTNLQALDLSWNQLSGPIPAELGNLANLENLWLQSNQLTGGLPVEVGSLTNLQLGVSLRQPVDWTDTGRTGQSLPTWNT